MMMMMNTSMAYEQCPVLKVTLWAYVQSSEIGVLPNDSYYLWK
jgi:hypothetical protein